MRCLQMMLWMAGSSVNIFSIMFTGMSLMNPLKAIANTNAGTRRSTPAHPLSLSLSTLASHQWHWRGLVDAG